MIYLVNAENTDLYKIGYTSVGAETRLKALKPDETGLGQFWQDGLPAEVL